MATIDKTKAVNQLLEEMKKTYATSTLGRYSELKEASKGKEFLSTGSIAVDFVLGGGFPKGQMSCITGYPSSGKTTIALMTIAQLQKNNPEAQVVYCDAEFALDPSYCKKLGVDMSRIILLQPANSEDAYDMIEGLIKSGLIDLVVIDSVAAMIPKDTADGSYSSTGGQIARMAVLTTKAVQRLNRLNGQYKTHIIWINQLVKATKIGMFDISSPSQLNTNFTMSGGQQFPFYMSQVVVVSRTSQIKQGDKIIANVISVKTTKNKVSVPYRQCETNINWNVGIDKAGELTLLGISQGLIVQSGTAYRFDKSITSGLKNIPEDFKIVGRQKVTEFLRSDDALAKQIVPLLDQAIRAKMFAIEDDGVNNQISISKKVDEGEVLEEVDESAS